INAFVSDNVPAASTADYLLVYDVGSSVGTHAPRLTMAMATGQISGLGATGSGVPVIASTLTVAAPSFTVADGPAKGGVKSVAAGSTGVSVAQWRVTNTGLEGLWMSNLSIQGSGSGDESILSSVAVYRDNNSDGL